MIIDCISDLHGEEPSLAGGDLLIIAGDITASNHIKQWKRFYDWVKGLAYEKVIYIAGNHDGWLEHCCNNVRQEELAKEFPEDVSVDESLIYLCDSGTEYQGLKIWGMPWTPIFQNWHFMADSRTREEKCALIPDDTDILITHGPPMQILDCTRRRLHVGCRHLRNALDRVKPKIHIFGHIHEEYGYVHYKHHFAEEASTLCINASVMNVEYDLVNAPWSITLDSGRIRMGRLE